MSGFEKRGGYATEKFSQNQKKFQRVQFNECPSKELLDELKSCDNKRYANQMETVTVSQVIEKSNQFWEEFTCEKTRLRSLLEVRLVILNSYKIYSF